MIVKAKISSGKETASWDTVMGTAKTTIEFDWDGRK